jgi:hypothetical protein
MKSKILLALSVGLLTAVSCQDDDFDREFDSSYPVSGEWYVQEYYGDGSAYGPYHVQTFNTSFSKDSLWVNNIYDSGIKVKALLNADKTFGVTQGQDFSEEVATVSISNGKMLSADSIYFDVVLYDEDGEIVDQFYTAGHRWTGLEGE